MQVPFPGAHLRRRQGQDQPVLTFLQPFLDLLTLDGCCELAGDVAYSLQILFCEDTGAGRIENANGFAIGDQGNDNGRFDIEKLEDLRNQAADGALPHRRQKRCLDELRHPFLDLRRVACDHAVS